MGTVSEEHYQDYTKDLVRNILVLRAECLNHNWYDISKITDFIQCLTSFPLATTFLDSYILSVISTPMIATSCNGYIELLGLATQQCSTIIMT